MFEFTIDWNNTDTPTLCPSDATLKQQLNRLAAYTELVATSDSASIQQLSEEYGEQRYKALCRDNVHKFIAGEWCVYSGMFDIHSPYHSLVHYLDRDHAGRFIDMVEDRTYGFNSLLSAQVFIDADADIVTDVRACIAFVVCHLELFEQAQNPATKRK